MPKIEYSTRLAYPPTDTRRIDPVESSPDNYKVLLENEHVRMLEMIVPAGGSDNKHSHPDETVYFITGGKTSIVDENGDTMEAELSGGATKWHPAWTHQVTNTGDTEIRAFIVDSKK
jgi:quercetin dioxygenase-like cupin family protein